MEDMKPCPFCGSTIKNAHDPDCYLFKLGISTIPNPDYHNQPESKKYTQEDGDKAGNTRAEHTCRNLATRNDDFGCSECDCEVVGCMVDDFGSFDNPLLFSFCPNCGAKVVE